MKTKGPSLTPPACRLAVKFARSAPVAILLRRGPTDWVQLITWSLDDDRFEPGQWFKGRVYEDLCDLSEDGELFVYSVRKANAWTTQHRDKVGETWTAISRPPFFTALGLWPNGCWDGGGLFTGSNRLTLGLPTPKAVPNHLLENLEVQGYPMPKHQPQQLSTLIALREGWQPSNCLAEALTGYYWRLLSPLEKIGCGGSVRVIRTTTQTKNDRNVDHFCVINEHGKTQIGITDFVDFDSLGRLVQGHRGRLLICSNPTEQLLQWRELADFSSARPAPLPPTDWARVWPERYQTPTLAQG